MNYSYVWVVRNDFHGTGKYCFGTIERLNARMNDLLHEFAYDEGLYNFLQSSDDEDINYSWEIVETVREVADPWVIRELDDWSDAREWVVTAKWWNKHLQKQDESKLYVQRLMIEESFMNPKWKNEK